MIKNSFCILLLCVFCIPSVFANEKHTITKFSVGLYYPSINSMVSRTDFKITIDFWLQELNQYVEMKQTEVRLFESIVNMQTAFNKGELSFIVAPPLLIVKYFDLTMLSDGFIGTSMTGKPYGIVILARNNKKITQLSDFKNKRLVLPENDELAHVFLDSTVISEFRESYQQISKSVKFLTKQNAIIHSLFFDKADIGVAFLETFNLMTELNPQISSRIKILKNLPINSPNYSFFHKSFPDEHRVFFIEEVLKLNDSAKSLQILSSFRMTSLSACTVNSLEPFIQLNKRYNHIKQQ